MEIARTMTPNSIDKRRIFISSVQKELELERIMIASLITTDPFLNEHMEPVLFDKEPISGRKASKPYLKCLDTCNLYLLMINRQYGRPHCAMSATHHEYQHAQKLGLPTLVFVKGRDDQIREAETRKFFEEIKEDGFIYKRFIDRLDLRAEVRAALIRTIKEEYGITPTEDMNKSGEETLEAASPFETGLTEQPLSSLNQKLVKTWLSTIGEIQGKRAPREELLRSLHTRGLLWLDRQNGEHYAVVAGVLFLGKNPSAVFPHCKILADAYRSNDPDPNPQDQDTVSAAAPEGIQTVVDFVKRNTRHPMRIVGLNRIVLDEYPEEAVREAIVNAIAHRNYEDRARSILVEVFFDHIVISSPGLPPKPLTLAKLRRGKYRPCSRNPVLAQCLASLKLMEQRGSGLGRMKAAMLDHGLDVPEFDSVDGYFQLTLRGPADDLNRLRIPVEKAIGTIPPSLEEELNERQKKIIVQLLREGSVSTGWCVKELQVVKDTARRDFNEMISLGILERVGKGRRTRYILKGAQPKSTDNRPTK